MSFWHALLPRWGAARSQAAAPSPDYREYRVEDEATRDGRDVTRLLLVLGLGALSWVATYVGMLELIEANLGDLALTHKVIIGFSVAMLMTMIIWLLDRMFAPVDGFTRICYVAGYLFLSVISVGFGFGFYWKVLESRGEASRSAASAITSVQSALFAASTRLEQLQGTFDQLTAISSEKSEIERSTGKSCPNSGPGDGPRRKMREDDAGRFKFASDFVKGRVGTVKSDMAALDGDLQKIVRDDRTLVDPRTGNRNEFLRGIGRKLDLTVTGFNAFRTDPQLEQMRTEFAGRAEQTTFSDGRRTVTCPDPQLQMALRGVVGAIDQLPELEKPKIAAVEGAEAVIEAFRRLTTSFFGLVTFKMPPSADELREPQKKAAPPVEGSGSPGQPAPRPAAYLEQSSGLAKRDYVPLGVAIFVDLCLLLVSIGRPINRFVGLERSMRAAERGPVHPILARFHDIHNDPGSVKYFEVFRDVIFDVNGQYHVAVPLNIPKDCPDSEELQQEAHRLANLCYALEGQGILKRPSSVLPPRVAWRQLQRRRSKFVACYGKTRPARFRRGWNAMQTLWKEMPYANKPAFKIYRFKKGAWPEMILQAVMRAPQPMEAERRLRGEPVPTPLLPNGHDDTAALQAPHGGWNGGAAGAAGAETYDNYHGTPYPGAQLPPPGHNGHEADPGRLRRSRSLLGRIARFFGARSRAPRPPRTHAAPRRGPADLEVGRIAGRPGRTGKDA